MIENQGYLFLVYTIDGILIGILFDIFRILRKSFKTKDLITHIEDICFWILTGLLLLYTIFTFSDGEIRIYMFLAIFVGCILYMLLISKYFISINVQIVFYLKKIIGKIFAIVFWPIRLLLKPIHFVTINLKKFTKEQYKNTKKIIKHQNDKIKA